MATIICPKCGNAVNGDNRYCTYCGCDLQSANTAPLQSSRQAQQSTYQQYQAVAAYPAVGYATAVDPISQWKSKSPKAKNILNTLTAVRWVSYALSIIVICGFIVLLMLSCFTHGMTQLKSITLLYSMFYPLVILDCTFLSIQKISPYLTSFYTVLGYAKWAMLNKINILDNSLVMETLNNVKNGKKLKIASTLKTKNNHAPIALLSAVVNENPSLRKNIIALETIFTVLSVLAWILFTIVLMNLLVLFTGRFIMGSLEFAYMFMNSYVPLIIMTSFGIVFSLAVTILGIVRNNMYTANTREWLTSHRI